MAQLKYIAFSQKESQTAIDFPTSAPAFGRFPVIHRADESLWREGCTYLAARASAVRLHELDIQTLLAEAKHLYAYLVFCEAKALDPAVFPNIRSEKPTYLFRAHLIRQRNARELAPSTASARINTIKRFYAWLIETGLLEPSSLPFIPRTSHVQTIDRYGYHRKFAASGSDLSIRSRSIGRSVLEGGLHPVSRELRDLMIMDAYRHGPEEFALILDLGFRSGMRLETNCLLTRSALLGAIRDGANYYIRVGPRSGIPTKLDVDYTAQIPKDLYERLIQYVSSPRRARRVAQATCSVEDLVFLNRYGRPYYQSGGVGAPAISAQLSNLKSRLADAKLAPFYFHCTRATFGTNLVMAGLNSGLPIHRIVKRLMDLLGHAHLSSSLKYISYVEQIEANERLDEEC